MTRALVAVALIACFACQRTSAPKRPVVGVTLLTETHAFFKELEDGSATRRPRAASIS